jgi:hypothetical protein
MHFNSTLAATATHDWLLLNCDARQLAGILPLKYIFEMFAILRNVAAGTKNYSFVIRDVCDAVVRA